MTPQPEEEQGPSAPFLPKDIYDFLSSYRLFPRSDATGSSEPIRIEPCEQPHVSSATSASGETRRSSDFDSAESSSSMSSVLPGPPLPCEFCGFDNCAETFDLNTVNDWVHHIVSQHLRGILPMNCICWFCDDAVFHAVNEDAHEVLRNFTARMRHIADHFREGATVEAMRPDFYFLDHLRDNGLIPEGAFLNAIDWHEAPQPRSGITTERPTPRLHQEAVVEVKSRRGRKGERQQQFYQ